MITLLGQVDSESYRTETPLAGYTGDRGKFLAKLNYYPLDCGAATLRGAAVVEGWGNYAGQNTSGHAPALFLAILKASGGANSCYHLLFSELGHPT